MAGRLRCAAHPGVAGVGVPGELHHCRGRGLDDPVIDTPAVIVNHILLLPIDLTGDQQCAVQL
jgi:hypothetical protein